MKTLLNNIRNRFLILFALMSTALILYMIQETNRVNTVTDQYLNIIVKTSWYTGCLHGTNMNKDLCQSLYKEINFQTLTEQIKSVIEESQRE